MIKVKQKIINIFTVLFYIFILIPIIVIAICILWQKIFFADKIPNILGWKGFIIINDNMTKTIESGDLIFTKIVDINALKENDIIAYRDNANYVKMHEISKIEESVNKTRKINVKNTYNDSDDVFYIQEQRIEGKYEYRIPKLGSILYCIQRPITLIILYVITCIIGGINIYISGKIDEKELNDVNNTDT